MTRNLLYFTIIIDDGFSLLMFPICSHAATIYTTYSRIIIFVSKPELSIITPRKVMKVLGNTSAFILQLAGGGMQTINYMCNIS